MVSRNIILVVSQFVNLDSVEGRSVSSYVNGGSFRGFFSYDQTTDTERLESQCFEILDVGRDSKFVPTGRVYRRYMGKWSISRTVTG
jgi:hypothetical protein